MWVRSIYYECAGNKNKLVPVSSTPQISDQFLWAHLKLIPVFEKLLVPAISLMLRSKECCQIQPYLQKHSGIIKYI